MINTYSPEKLSSKEIRLLSLQRLDLTEMKSATVADFIIRVASLNRRKGRLGKIFNKCEKSARTRKNPETPFCSFTNMAKKVQ